MTTSRQARRERRAAERVARKLDRSGRARPANDQAHLHMTRPTRPHRYLRPLRPKSPPSRPPAQKSTAPTPSTQPGRAHPKENWLRLVIR